MSIGAHLIHRCTIARRQTRPDELRGEIVTYDEEHLRNQPVRLVVKTSRVYSSERGALISQITYQALLPPGLDVRAGDRLQDVVFEDGSESDALYEITSIATRRGRAARHITLELELYE